MPMEILEDQMAAKSDELCPRVESEMILKPFKVFFEKAFSNDAKKFKENPALLVNWVRANIKFES